MTQPEVPVPTLKPIIFLGLLDEPNTAYSKMFVLNLEQLYYLHYSLYGTKPSPFYMAAFGWINFSPSNSFDGGYLSTE